MSKYQDPDNAEAAFYRAFEHCDLHAMQQTWEPSEKVSCIHPGGPLLQGYVDVVQSWGEIFSQTQPPQIHYRVLQRLQENDLAVHTVEEAIRPSDSSDDPTRLIATNLYRRGADGWRMIGHHACLPLVERWEAPPGPMH
jgi:ketosteroid isomerase-like protein